MPVDPASQEARRAEIERRRAAQAAAASGRSAHPQSLFGNRVNSIQAGARPGVVGASGYLYSAHKPLPKFKKIKPKVQTFEWEDEDWSTLTVGLCKTRERAQDIKRICPRCTLTVHTVHLGWPPETPIVRWLEDGNPLGGRMSVGHEPQSGLVGDTVLEEGEMLAEEEDEDDVVAGPSALPFAVSGRKRPALQDDRAGARQTCQPGEV